VTEFFSMKVCNRIRDLIDQSHRADALPPEAAAHAEFCDACRKFAEERESLRALLSEGARVNVPGNFNAVLNQRLEAVRGKRRTFARFTESFSGAMLTRLATAAAAAVLAAILVPQFFAPQNPQQGQLELAGDSPAAQQPAAAPQPQRLVDSNLDASSRQQASTLFSDRNRRVAAVASRSRGGVPFADVRTGVMLVREGGRDEEMSFSTVTVGAQPIVLGGEASSPARMTRAASF
jgi:hypothetical protein